LEFTCLRARAPQFVEEIYYFFFAICSFHSRCAWRLRYPTRYRASSA
jgi:hypothetical protein